MRGYEQEADEAFREFKGARRFPALDGLRALSILMVLTVHMHDPFMWDFFNGSFGVTMFFCISGFLITTLLLREEDANGRVSLRGFYIRRVFRILPLYLLALVLATVLVLGFGLGSGGDTFLQRLPLLATFNGEFAGSGTFSHSWSLGIEEKFYILWPLLAFGVPFVRSHIGAVLGVLLPAALAAAFIEPVAYFGIYMPIIGGCALAVAMHHRRSFGVVFALARPWIGASLFVVMLIMSELSGSLPWKEAIGYAHVTFAVAVLLALPGTLIGKAWPRRLLSLRPVVFYGQLAYGIYLFHPFVGEVVDMFAAPGSESVPQILARFIAMFVGSFALAWVLKISVEDPMISLGRRLARASRSRAPVPAAAASILDQGAGRENPQTSGQG
ncbi:MAG: acyltransferase [Microbacterium sp.]